MTVRETAFLCTWCTPAEERRMYVRAWTAREALELLRAELRAADIAVPDEVTLVKVGKPLHPRLRETWAGDEERERA